MGRALRHGIATLGSIAVYGEEGAAGVAPPATPESPSVPISGEPSAGRPIAHAFVSGPTVATGGTVVVRRSIESCRGLTHSDRECG